MRVGVFLLPLDGMLALLRVTPSIKLTKVERGTVRVKYLAQENNRVTPARVRARAA